MYEYSTFLLNSLFEIQSSLFDISNCEDRFFIPLRYIQNDIISHIFWGRNDWRIYSRESH